MDRYHWLVWAAASLILGLLNCINFPNVFSVFCSGFSVGVAFCEVMNHFMLGAVWKEREK